MLTHDVRQVTPTPESLTVAPNCLSPQWDEADQWARTHSEKWRSDICGVITDARLAHAMLPCHYQRSQCRAHRIMPNTRQRHTIPPSRLTTLRLARHAHMLLWTFEAVEFGAMSCPLALPRYSIPPFLSSLYLENFVFHLLSYFFVDLFPLQMKSTCKYAAPVLLSI